MGLIRIGVWFIGIIIGILVLTTYAGKLDTGEQVITYVNCYDRYGNEIIGQVCEEITYVGNEKYYYILIPSMIFTLMWFFSLPSWLGDLV